MKKLLRKIRQKLIRALGGEIPVPIKKPLVITETVPLSVIEARQYIPAQQYLRLPPDAVKRDMERLLAVKIGEEIVKACGVQKGYDALTDIYCFRVAVEVTGRSFKKEGEDYEKAETCVVCGKVIPEGRQVCPNCEKDVK